MEQLPLRRRFAVAARTDDDPGDAVTPWPLGTAPRRASAILTAAPHRTGNGGVAASRITIATAMTVKIIAGEHAEKRYMDRVTMQLRVQGLILTGRDIDAPSTTVCSECSAEVAYCRPRPTPGPRSVPPPVCMTCYPPDCNPETLPTTHG